MIRVQDQGTMNSNNLLGRVGPKKLTLGFGSKVWKNRSDDNQCGITFPPTLDNFDSREYFIHSSLKVRFTKGFSDPKVF